MLLMRRASFILGVTALAAAWLGPLPALAQEFFAAHMTMHMTVVAVAAPLLAMGLGGSPYDPARKAPQWFAPIQASMLELVVVWAWHAPALHHAARHHSSAFIAEQAMFFAAGLFLWLSAFGGDDAAGGKRGAAGVVGLLLTAMHMTLLGALLALSPRPLYTHLHERATGFAALASLDDQHLGGAIMLVIGSASYLAGGVGLTLRLLRRSSFVTARRT
jgi:putative membrane protein